MASALEFKWLTPLLRLSYLPSALPSFAKLSLQRDAFILRQRPTTSYRPGNCFLLPLPCALQLLRISLSSNPRRPSTSPPIFSTAAMKATAGRTFRPRGLPNPLSRAYVYFCCSSVQRQRSISRQVVDKITSVVEMTSL